MFQLASTRATSYVGHYTLTAANAASNLVAAGVAQRNDDSYSVDVFSLKKPDKIVSRLPHSAPPTCARFLRDDTLLLTTALDGKLRLWDVSPSHTPGHLVWETQLGSEHSTVEEDHAELAFACCVGGKNENLLIGSCGSVVEVYQLLPPPANDCLVGSSSKRQKGLVGGSSSSVASSYHEVSFRYSYENLHHDVINCMKVIEVGAKQQILVTGSDDGLVNFVDLRPGKTLWEDEILFTVHNDANVRAFWLMPEQPDHGFIGAHRVLATLSTCETLRFWRFSEKALVPVEKENHMDNVEMEVESGTNSVSLVAQTQAFRLHPAVSRDNALGFLIDLYFDEGAVYALCGGNDGRLGLFRIGEQGQCELAHGFGDPSVSIGGKSGADHGTPGSSGTGHTSLVRCALLRKENGQPTFLTGDDEGTLCFWKTGAQGGA